MGEESWGSSYDNDNKALLVCCLLPLIFLSIVFDEGVHGLTHWLERKRQREDTLQRMLFESHNIWEIYHFLFTRFKSEMMVLGYLAFIVWCCNIGGVFPMFVEAYWGGAPDGSSSSSSDFGSGGERGGESGSVSGSTGPTGGGCSSDSSGGRAR